MSLKDDVTKRYQTSDFFNKLMTIRQIFTFISKHLPLTNHSFLPTLEVVYKHLTVLTNHIYRQKDRWERNFSHELYKQVPISNLSAFFPRKV